MTGAGGPRGVPRTGRLSFRVMRNGSALGTHTVGFSRDGGRLRVEIAADYVFKLAFVTLYRYRLRAHEIWENGLLQSARSEGNNNGKPVFLNFDRDGREFRVDGSAAKFRAPPDARLATHWNSEQLGGMMINPQDGAILPYKVAPRGRVQVADAAGRLKEADHYLLSGDPPPPLELWYDADRIWSSLKFRAGDGSSVTFLAD